MVKCNALVLFLFPFAHVEGPGRRMKASRALHSGGVLEHKLFHFWLSAMPLTDTI